MANYPVIINNLPNGPIGVKSEFWLESRLDGVDLIPGPFAFVQIQLNTVPSIGSYFELKFKGLTLRFTFTSPAIFNKQVVKTEYGFNIAVLHTLGSIESCKESLLSTLISTAQLKNYYSISAEGIKARYPGAEWAFDVDLLFGTPFTGEYYFDYSNTDPLYPENLMLAMSIGLDPAKDNQTGNPVPLIFSRPQIIADGSFRFFHRIDELCIAQIDFELPYNANPLPLDESLAISLPNLIKTARFQIYQASGQPVVIQQGFTHEVDKYIVRSGISTESYKSLGNNWFEEFVLQQRGGVLSYFDRRVCANWQKLIYLASMREGQDIRLFAKPRVLNSLGEVVQYNFISLGVSSYSQGSPFEIISFNLGGNFIDKLIERIDTVLGITNYKLLGFSAFLAENDAFVLFKDLGYFEYVPEIYGTYCIHYENDFGGLSDCWMMGGLSEFREIDKTEYQALGYNPGVSKHQKSQKVNVNITTYEANSGAVDKDRLLEICEMLHSENVWITAKDGVLIPISIEKSKATIGKDDFSGEYQYALNIKFSRAYNRQATAGEDIFVI